MPDIFDETLFGGDGNDLIYSSVLMLMMRSHTHRHMLIGDLEWSIMVPIAMQQFRLFQNDKGPIGYATWAFLSEEVAEQFPTRQGQLKPTEWRSGQECWIVDLVAPEGGRAHVVEQLRSDILSDHLIHIVKTDHVSGDRIVEKIPSGSRYTNKTELKRKGALDIQGKHLFRMPKQQNSWRNTEPLPSTLSG
jgi:cytolysin-activating lysine-acyltransferase